jgi:hypothetical protein
VGRSFGSFWRHLAVKSRNWADHSFSFLNVGGGFCAIMKMTCSV